MQDWWQRGRYGLVVQASLAAVPSWAPIGESATWYRAQLGHDVSDTLLHPSPLAETIEHHRRNWPDIEHYDDFAPRLHFEGFDAQEWTQVALDAGMHYFAMTAKHYDGWCWWNAPNTTRRLTDVGPCRDVFGEVARAVDEAGLVLGAEYSLLDWADPRHNTAEYVEQVVHRHLADLIDRYNVAILRGRGHWGASGEHWRSDELIAKLRQRRPDLIVNDRFWATTPGVRSIEWLTDWFVSDRDWELTRSIGSGSGFNQADPDDRLLTPREIVALLTEVIARGGHLSISIGPDAFGRLPAEQVARLAQAGRWVRRHSDLIERASPRKVWGDDTVRYFDLDGRLVAVHTDPRGQHRMRFPHLSPRDCPIHRVVDADGAAVGFEQNADGLVIHRSSRNVADDELAAVFAIDVDDQQAIPIQLFDDLGPAHTALAEVLRDAQPGDVVQLGEGTYQGPARIPDGVTVRGLGADRTALAGGTDPAVVLGEGSHLEHCRVAGGRRIAWLPKTSVLINGSDATLLACQVDGHVQVVGGAHTKISSCQLSGVVAERSPRVSVVRSNFVGMGWDCSIDIDGGDGHLIESNTFADALQAVRLVNTVGATVRNNTGESRWWFVQLIDTDASHVFGNRIERTMRAVDISGGADNQVTSNAVCDGDSGCVIRCGAANSDVTGNRWERLRVGLFAWEAGPYRAEGNSGIDIDEQIEIVGPGAFQ